MKYNTTIVLAYFKEQGLPACETEFKFHPDRKWRFDFSFPEKRVALECDGGIFVYGRHTRASGFVKDMEKYNAAVCLGWRILRCQPKDLCTQETVDMIRKALDQ